MNKHVKNLIKAASFTLLLVGILTPIAHFLFIPLDSSVTSYGSFYKEKEQSLDLVMVGSSTVRDGFIPLEAYHDYGITAHSVDSSPTHLEVIKIAIDEIERTQSPKVVYVDLNGLNNQTRDSAQSFVQDYFDCMPDGEAKDAVKARLAEEGINLTTKSDWEVFAHHNGFRQQIYWESFVYNHQMWTKGYYPNSTVTKGMEIHEVAKENPSDTPEISQDGKKYLKDILEIASKYKDKTHFIFGQMPRYLQDDIVSFDLYQVHDPLTAFYMVRSAKKQVEEAGFEFVEWCDPAFLAKTLKIDPNLDQFDAEHLNHRGAKKFTAYFSSYLMDNYLGDMPKFDNGKIKHDDAIVEDFDEAYEKYREIVGKVETKLGM